MLNGIQQAQLDTIKRRLEVYVVNQDNLTLYLSEPNALRILFSTKTLYMVRFETSFADIVNVFAKSGLKYARKGKRYYRPKDSNLTIFTDFKRFEVGVRKETIGYVLTYVKDLTKVKRELNFNKINYYPELFVNHGTIELLPDLFLCHSKIVIKELPDGTLVIDSLEHSFSDNRHQKHQLHMLIEGQFDGFSIFTALFLSTYLDKVSVTNIFEVAEQLDINPVNFIGTDMTEFLSIQDFFTDEELKLVEMFLY